MTFHSKGYDEQFGSYKIVSKIETPEYPDRTQWVYDLGYKLWSEKEIRDGTVFKRFKNKLGL